MSRRNRKLAELGKAMCDRLGLPHNMVLNNWSAEDSGSFVMVTMSVVKMMPKDEYKDLLRVAELRAAEVSE